MNISLISIEAVAAKLRQVTRQTSRELTEQFLGQPELAEAIGLIEWQNRQPGGIGAFAEEFLRFAGKNLLPAAFWRIATDSKGRFMTADDLLFIWHSLPAAARPQAPSELRETVEILEGCDITEGAPAFDCGLVKLEPMRQWFTQSLCVETCRRAAIDPLIQRLTDFFFKEEMPLPASLRLDDDARQRERLRAGAEFYRALNSGASPGSILSDLEELAPAPRVEVSQWPILEGLPGLLIGYMEQRAEAERTKIAQTKITKMVYDALDYAWCRKTFVNVIGSSRFGKTESIKAYCVAHPGRASLVRTPDGNSKKDLLLAAAQALGLSVDCGITLAKLRERVRFILENTRQMLVFDEGQFLFPEAYSSRTPPARLNLIRTEVIDKHLPCVVSATPQGMENAKSGYLKTTNYCLQQWDGRADVSYVLPERFEKTDLVEVARMRFSEMPEDIIRKIVQRAQQSAQFLHAIETIGNRAAWLAQRDRAKQPTAKHVQQAAEELTNGVRAPEETNEPQSELGGDRLLDHATLGAGALLKQF
jgi:hypothetical protein